LRQILHDKAHCNVFTVQRGERVGDFFVFAQARELVQ
jgi:hypothetical protein